MDDTKGEFKAFYDAECVDDGNILVDAKRIAKFWN